MKPTKRLPAICMLLLILLSVVPSFYQGRYTVEGAADPDDYLKIALKEPVDTLNPLLAYESSTSLLILDRIYEGISIKHEDTHRIIPWLASDWSPIERSGKGVYDPEVTYTDPDPSTVANEDIPSEKLEVIIQIRKNVSFHRSEDWLDIGEDWQSPKSDFTLPGTTMETMTAHDVIFTAEMILVEMSKYDPSFTYVSLEPLGDETSTEDEHWIINGGSGMYDGMQMLDNHTIKVTLTEKWPRFYELAFPIVLPMKIWAKHTMLDPSGRSAKNWGCGIYKDIFRQRELVSGTGPFMWTDWEPSSYIRLDKNTDYFVDGSRDNDKKYGFSMKNIDYRPMYPGVTFKIFSNVDESVVVFEEGGLDAIGWGADRDYASKILEIEGTRTIGSPELSYSFLSFNMRKPAFGYKEHPGPGNGIHEWYGEDISCNFRKAISLAVDKPYIINQVYNDRGDTAHSMVPEANKLYHNESVRKYTYDLQRAKELLDEQNEIWQNEFPGFPDWDPPGYDELPDDYPIPTVTDSGSVAPSTDTIQLLSVNNHHSPVNHQIAISIANTLKGELGIQIEAKAMSRDNFISDVTLPSEYDIILHDWFFDGYESIGSLALLTDSISDDIGGLNLPGFRNKRLDELVEQSGVKIQISVRQSPPPPIDPPPPPPIIIFGSSMDTASIDTNIKRGEIILGVKYGPEYYLEGGELPDESGTNIDYNTRIKLLKDMQGIISERSPYSILFSRKQSFLCNDEWLGWVPSPGGILNIYSFGHLERTKGEGTIRITALSNMMCNEKQDVSIMILGEDLLPRENVAVKLFCSHDEAIFKSEDGYSSGSDGRINATFIPPEVDEPTIVTIRVETENEESSSAIIMVHPIEDSEFYLNVEVDMRFLEYDEEAIIELELNSYDINLQDVNVSSEIEQEGSGRPKLSRKFPIKMDAGQMMQFTFSASDIENGTIEEYEIHFEAATKGVEPVQESIKIQVQGGPIEEKENKNEDSPFPNITFFILVVILLTYLKKKKPYSR
ncbi:MAG: ABC transporter substrate-binding protein [Thermoplasmata archaeon]